MLGDLLIAHIRQLFEWVLPACLRFVRKNVKEIQPSLDTNLAQACMRLFYSLLDELRPSGSEEAPVPPKGKLLITFSHMCNSTWSHAPATTVSPYMDVPCSKLQSLVHL